MGGQRHRPPFFFCALTAPAPAAEAPKLRRRLSAAVLRMSREAFRHYGDGVDGANLAGGAVDLMEAASFRCFTAVNGLRPPQAAREARH